MLEGASAGGTSIPAPVQIFVYDAELCHAQAYVRRHRYGIAFPIYFALGIPYLVLGILIACQPHKLFDLWPLGLGLMYTANAWAPKGAPEIIRPADLEFSAEGIDVTVGFTGRPPRCYRWPRIRRIDDTGEVFIIVPKFGTRIVVPKRSFPDDGREAWAFFAAHGVAGRTPPMPAPVAS